MKSSLLISFSRSQESAKFLLEMLCSLGFFKSLAYFHFVYRVLLQFKDTARKTDLRTRMGSAQTRITRRMARRRNWSNFWWPRRLLCLRNERCTSCTPKTRFSLLNLQRKIVRMILPIIDFYSKCNCQILIRLDDKMFDDILSKVQNINNSVFLQRTEDSSASQYFQFYGYLSQQQNMMQDFVRTSTYQKAIHGNYSDFNVRHKPRNCS